MIYKIEYCKYLTDIINGISHPKWYEFRKKRKLGGLTGNDKSVWGKTCLRRLEEISNVSCRIDMDIIEQFNALQNIISSWVDIKIETYDEFVINTRDRKLKKIL